MAPAENPAEGQPSVREPMSPAKRKRLQKIFEHGCKQMASEEYDYATKLFAQCVSDDPGNPIYVQNYIGNLQKRYNNNKKGSNLAQFKELGARSALKKALAQSQWDDVIRNGLKVLAVNPWDITALTAMATAAEKSGDGDCEMLYLRCARDANPKDPDVNRQTASALGERKRYDEAIALWHRVEQARPGDEEAQREIAKLAVQKTIDRGGYEGDDAGGRLAGKGQGQQESQRELTIEERLEQRISANPEDLSNYYELAQLHLNNENYQGAENVFSRAYNASGSDPDVRERWEDAQLRRLRQQILQTSDPETRKRLQREYYQKDLALHKSRSERFPNNLAFRYDLGLRYQFCEQYNEAIKEYQQARNDPRRKGLCMLRLGQCFQEIKQYRLSQSHYESAIEEIPDRDATNKKKALHLAGKMALFLKDLDAADKHLNRLAGLDFNYKDVAALLDKLGRMRDNPQRADAELEALERPESE